MLTSCRVDALLLIAAVLGLNGTDLSAEKYAARGAARPPGARFEANLEGERPREPFDRGHIQA